MMSSLLCWESRAVVSQCNCILLGIVCSLPQVHSGGHLVYTCNCTLTNAFHSERTACMTIYFIDLPYAIFRGRLSDFNIPWCSYLLQSQTCNIMSCESWTVNPTSTYDFTQLFPLDKTAANDCVCIHVYIYILCENRLQVWNRKLSCTVHLEIKHVVLRKWNSTCYIFFPPFF